MWFRKILATLMLAILASSAASAQTGGELGGARAQLPWKRYVASRIPDGYQTIIGRPGTQLMANSTNASGSTAFSFPASHPYGTNFPIAFRFLGTNYPAGSITPRVVAAGYISFSGSGSGSSNPNLGVDGNTRLIMPYWSDVQPNGISEGGIFWRVDGTVGNRILTVEWRVGGIAAPNRNPGQFQALLYEQSGKIEFFYGPNSVDRSRANGTQGAAVGLKDQGFPNGLDPATDTDDQTKFLLLMHPDQVRDTVALTRTRNVFFDSFGFGCTAFGNFCVWTPEVTASWTYQTGVNPNGPSPFFHYSFPTLNGVRRGYRMTPTLNDVATDSAWFSPTRTGNAFNIGAQITVNARFVNIGVNSRSNVPVQVDILRIDPNTGLPTGAVLVSRFDTAFRTPTNQFGTNNIQFSPSFQVPGGAASPGTYVARIYSRLTSPADEDFANDTLYKIFYISYPNDVAGYRIIQPVSNTPVFPQIYPVGYGVSIEADFINLGTNTQSNVPVGFTIYDAAGIAVYTDRNGLVRGQWDPLEIRNVVFSSWTPTNPSTYYIKFFTLLTNDDQKSNDTMPRFGLGHPFTVRYEIEIQAELGSTPGSSPIPNGMLGGDYPDGRPVPVIVGFRNNGFVDATNVPAVVEIRTPDHNGTLVYRRNSTILNVGGDGATALQRFPDFIPNGSGTYCLTAYATDQQDPLRSNDTVRWCFSVRPRLAGIIRVGLGERFRTIQEANDSLYRYGVSAPVTFELVDDQFIVRPNNNDPSNPSYDARGDVIGLGPTRPVLWRPVAGKDSVTIYLKSPSGIGFWYGQRDTTNSSGYQTWDGGPDKKLRFVMDTAGTLTPNRVIPFFFSQGSSNYGVKNSHIRPLTVSIGQKSTASALLLSVPLYNQSFNQFTYLRDQSITISSGILLRNSAPADVNGNNPADPSTGRRRDTLRNQNNAFEGNVISDFAFGITSIGAGPLYRVLDNAFVEYSNQNNRYSGNLIQDVGRAGIAVLYEKNSAILDNTIRRVENTDAIVQHAAGVWVSSGGYDVMTSDSVKNRAYSSDLQIERNKVSTVSARTGNGVGIWVETPENIFRAQTREFRFPVNGATNHRIWNNMVWDYRGQSGFAGPGRTAGIAMSIAPNNSLSFTTRGNKIENNTIFNRIAGNVQEYGVLVQRHGASIRNNIISILTPSTTNPIGLVIQMPNYKQNIVSDYNIFQVDSGFVGALSNLATNGFNIPSPPAARTLNQWRALTGLDSNSVQGNIAADFVNITPGSENLHIRPNIVGSLANNRGINIAGLTNDVDSDPRGSGGGAGRYDIGADEFNGQVRNNDLAAEDIFSVFGYRAPTGRFSDAEYVMTDSAINLIGRFRNMGGLPQTSNTVTMRIERFNGFSWINSGTITRTNSFNVAQARDINFGQFVPLTLNEVGETDAFYGRNPNISPLYRFTLSSGIDDFQGNNIYEKTVRFYSLRSDLKTIVTVENYNAVGATGVALGNKLNADTLVAALGVLGQERADGIAREDYDLFERDKWPVYSLNFKPWKTVIWAQGEEPQGMEAEERQALKIMLDSRSTFERSNLVIAGQEVIRKHDVALTSTNGQVSDQDFVRNYLRQEYVGPTTPADYSGRHIRGIGITPGKYERIMRTAVVGDAVPMPSIGRVNVGQGIARATHNYTELSALRPDSAAGAVTAAPMRNVVAYNIDWRHYGRFAFEPTASGAHRLLRGALDFIDYNEGVLPVKLVSFDAFQSGQKTVSVEWKTLEEIDVASLEIERAVVERGEQGERVGDFTVVSRQTPRGSATTGSDYRITDRDVENGVEYRYRLVSVSLDGQRTVDAEKLVKVIGAGDANYSLTVSPNPARTVATIQLRVPEGDKVSVEIFDVNGRLLQTLVNRDELSSSNLELNVEDLASGAYSIRLTTTSGVTLIEKLSVQK